MRISDTLDQLLRSIASGNPNPAGAGADDAELSDAEPSSTAADERPEPLALDLEAAAAEVAVKRAHELDGPGSATPEARDPEGLAGLEASAGAIENLGLGFHLGAAIERIALAAGEGSEGRLRLREAKWLIERYIALLEQRPVGADLHASSARLARTGETIAELHEIRAELTTPPKPAAPPAPEPTPEPGPTQPEPVAGTEPASDEPQVVYELPTVKREIFVAIIRAGIAVAAVTLLVLVLTLIAQWR